MLQGCESPSFATRKECRLFKYVAKRLGTVILCIMKIEGIRIFEERTLHDRFTSFEETNETNVKETDKTEDTVETRVDHCEGISSHLRNSTDQVFSPCYYHQ